MFNDVEIIDPYAEEGIAPRVGLTLATSSEVDVAEKGLRTSFPAGYREFVTSLGKGTFYGWNTAIRVLMPSEIVTGYRERQRFLAEYWFWEGSEDILPKSAGIESIVICENDIGDVVIFHPDDPDRLFVLSEAEEFARLVGNNLEQVIDWMIERGRDAARAKPGSHLRRAFAPFNRFVRTSQVITPKQVYE